MKKEITFTDYNSSIGKNIRKTNEMIIQDIIKKIMKNKAEAKIHSKKAVVETNAAEAQKENEKTVDETNEEVVAATNAKK